MKAKRFGLVVVATLLALCAAAERLGAAEPVATSEPGWTPRIVKLGEDRERTNSLEITARPYRPFHFYGNTIRRLYYRGNPLPTSADLGRTFRYALQLRE